MTMELFAGLPHLDKATITEQGTCGMNKNPKLALLALAMQPAARTNGDIPSPAELGELLLSERRFPLHWDTLRRRGNAYEYGAEGTFVGSLRITRWVLATTELDVLEPFSDWSHPIVDWDSNVGIRLALWKDASLLISAHPLLGVDLARAKRDQAKVDLERTVIRAPMDGVVAKRQVQLGQRVQAGAPLLSLVPVQDMYVNANFKEGDWYCGCGNHNWAQHDLCNGNFCHRERSFSQQALPARD